MTTIGPASDCRSHHDTLAVNEWCLLSTVSRFFRLELDTAFATRGDCPVRFCWLFTSVVGASNHSSRNTWKLLRHFNRSYLFYGAKTFENNCDNTVYLAYPSRGSLCY